MICPNCGAQNRDDAKFCKSCGTPLRTLAPGAKNSLATVAGGSSTEATMVIGLEAVFLSGLRKGERVTITTFPATIGRDPNSVLPLALQDQLASTRHAQILREGDGYLLRDVGSSNGTYHNGHRIKEVWLKHADVIEFGVGGPQVRFDFIRQSPTPHKAVDPCEVATLPPIPAVSAGTQEPGLSPTVGHDIVPPSPTSAVRPGAMTVVEDQSSARPAEAPPPPPPPPPPFPAAGPPSPFAGTTTVQEDPHHLPEKAYPADYQAPSGLPPADGDRKSNLVLLIVIGGVAVILVVVVVAVVAYFLFSSK